MSDRYGRHPADVTAPARQGYIPTPNDSADLPEIGRGLFVVEEGDIQFVFAGYEDDPTDPSVDVILLEAVAANTILPFAVRRIGEATTATVLVLY